MKYIFKDGEEKGEYPVKNYRVCWYDTLQRGACFDETIYSKDVFDPNELLAYIETEDDDWFFDTSRVFAEMKNGDWYELKLVKIKNPQDLCWVDGK